MTADPLRELVAVMDRLRSPGGCPWDAEQTHASLVPYAIEEAYEVAEAVENDDRANLREELGDLLLQVVFHARIAQEDADDPWGVDDVAGDLVAKLIRRHPHVFADAQAEDPDGVHRQWERIKKAEKSRDSVFDGIPLGLGALARTQKIGSRAHRTDLDVPAPADGSIGSRLLALVIEAQQQGLDAEGELRRTAREWEAGLRAAESTD
ncbi:MazG family protein [Cellulomonas fimi]|uniref:MazG family protein n=1 Tax=Cellulomonas sp. RIT-PI-Y TaxID=3035297 RepID=UPI0021DB3C17